MKVTAWATGCWNDLCHADPSSLDYAHARDNFGLEQLNADSIEESQHSMAMNSRYAIWQAGRVRGEGDLSADIVAIDLETGVMQTTGDGMTTIQALPYLAGHSVLFAEELKPGHPEAPAPSRLVLWDLANQTRRVVDPGLGGATESEGFDGRWALFWLRGPDPPHRPGTWVVDTMTNEARPLWLLPDLPPDQQERFQGGAVMDGVAFLGIERARRLAMPEGEAWEYNTTIERHDLTTGEVTTFYHHPAYSTGDVDAADGWVTWELASPTRVEVWAASLSAGEAFRVSDARDDGFWAGTGGGWVLYRQDQDDRTFNQSIEAMNLSTRQKYVVQPDHPDFHLYAGDTDGKRYLLAGSRNSYDFGSLGHDMYVGTLPDGPT